MALDGEVWEDIGGQCRIPSLPTAGFAESVIAGSQQTCMTTHLAVQILFVLCCCSMCVLLSFLYFLYLGPRSRLPTSHL